MALIPCWTHFPHSRISNRVLAPTIPQGGVTNPYPDGKLPIAGTSDLDREWPFQQWEGGDSEPGRRLPHAGSRGDDLGARIQRGVIGPRVHKTRFPHAETGSWGDNRRVSRDLPPGLGRSGRTAVSASCNWVASASFNLRGPLIIRSASSNHLPPRAFAFSYVVSTSAMMMLAAAFFPTRSPI